MLYARRMFARSASVPRLIAAASLAAAAVLGAPALGAAQDTTGTGTGTGGIGITLNQVEHGADVIKGADFNAFSADECADASNVLIAFNVMNSPSVLKYDVWRGGTGSQCQLSNSRTEQNATCVELGVNPDRSSTDGSFALTLADLGVCGSDSDFTLYVFATNESTTTGDVSADKYGSITLRVDTTPPAAPAFSSTTLSGDASVNLSWGAAGETEVRYRLYIDTAPTPGGGDGTCTSAKLTTGQTGPTEAEADAAGLDFIETSTDVKGRTLSLDERGLNLPVGGQAAVYLSAVDKIGNASVISAPACVTRVETQGFCDLYEAQNPGKRCTTDCTVAAPGGAGGPMSALYLVGLAAFGLLLRRRRSA